MNKFNELVKTVNENIDYLSYTITPDNKLVLAAECYEEAERTKKACIDAYRSLNRACRYLEEDMMSSDAFAEGNSAWQDHHVLVAQKYLPKIYAKFMALWEKRCEKDNRK